MQAEPAPVGLAVSGGPDSLALLLLANAAFPGGFEVATVDHGIRAEGAAEAITVGRICTKLGIRHATLRVDLGSGPALQERARKARYSALGEWAVTGGLRAIATAHHADDQAETVLMRLARGAGVRGLAGMRAHACVPGWPECALLRPLLGWRRSELEKIVNQAGMKAAVDPSNTNDRFERVRMRKMLAAFPALDPAFVATSASHLAQADSAIEWATQRSFASVETHEGVVYWAPADTPRVIALRILERILARFGPGTPRGNAISRWHDRLAAGKVATLGGVRGDGRSSTWRFAAARAPRFRPSQGSESP